MNLQDQQNSILDIIYLKVKPLLPAPLFFQRFLFCFVLFSDTKINGNKDERRMLSLCGSVCILKLAFLGVLIVLYTLASAIPQKNESCTAVIISDTQGWSLLSLLTCSGSQSGVRILPVTKRLNTAFPFFTAITYTLLPVM